MSYVVIADVPASWERYARAGFLRVPGMLLHAAGPTGEGFRIVELWDSESAWQAFAPRLDAWLASVDPDIRPRAVVRELRALHVVRGGAWDDMAESSNG